MTDKLNEPAFYKDLIKQKEYLEDKMSKEKDIIGKQIWYSKLYEIDHVLDLYNYHKYGIMPNHVDLDRENEQ